MLGIGEVVGGWPHLQGAFAGLASLEGSVGQTEGRLTDDEPRLVVALDTSQARHKGVAALDSVVKPLQVMVAEGLEEVVVPGGDVVPGLPAVGGVGFLERLALGPEVERSL